MTVNGKIALTGATGFIGKHIVKLLRDSGREVRCITRKSSRTSQLRKFDCEIVQAELNDDDALLKAVKGCDTVFHLAGKVKNSTPGDLMAINRDGTRNVALACRKLDAPPLLVYFSSLAAAGPSSLDAPRNETDQCSPVSRYGRSKLAAERELSKLANDLPISIIRPPIVFGEEDEVTGGLFSTIKRFGLYLRPGCQTKQYSLVHADDLATAAFAIEASGRRLTVDHDCGQGIYFAAYDTPLTGTEFACKIGETVGQVPVVLPVPHIVVRAVAAMNEMVSLLTPVKPFVNWDKAREATAASWTCSVDKLVSETEAQFAALEDRLVQAAEGYRQKGLI